MEDKRIKEQIRQTFNSEVPDVLNKIKASPDFRVPQKQHGFRIQHLLRSKSILMLTSIFILSFVLIIGITRSNNVVASTVTLELNPSITITLNRNDIVIGVTAFNDDGIEVIDRNIKYKGLTIDEAIEVIVSKLNELGYIVDVDDINNIILIEVNSDNQEIRTRIQEKFEVRLQSELDKYNKSHWVFNSDDFSLTDDQLRIIRDHDLLQKMSATKLALIYRINTLDDSYSLNSLSKMSIRDLYDLYLSLEDPNNLPHRNNMPDPRNRTGLPYTDGNLLVIY